MVFAKASDEVSQVFSPKGPSRFEPSRSAVSTFALLLKPRCLLLVSVLCTAAEWFSELSLETCGGGAALLSAHIGSYDGSFEPNPPILSRELSAHLLWRLRPEWIGRMSNGGGDFLWATLENIIPPDFERDVCLPVAPLGRHSCCCLMFGLGLRIALMSVFLGGSRGLSLSFFSFLIEVFFPWDEKEVSLASLWESEWGWQGDSSYFMGSTFLRAGPLKSVGAVSWSRRSRLASFGDISLRDTGSLLVFDKLIDLTLRSLATGDGCLNPGLSKVISRQREVGDGLNLGAGMVKVEATAGQGWGWRSNGDGSVKSEAGRWGEWLGFGFRVEWVGEEFGFCTGKMEIRGFAERDGELCDLGLALGRVDAPSLWFHCESWDDLLQEGWLDVLEKQLCKKSLR